MTKRKAIEAALAYANRQHRDFGDPFGGISNPTDYALTASDQAFEFGRIAGLREGVQVLRDKAGSASWYEQEKLREHANQLTKKARQHR